MRASLLALVLFGAADTALAFTRVTEPTEFAALVVDREISRTGIRLQVRSDGMIEGRGLGWPVTGDWRWSDGYFCRTMDWSGYEIPFNCMAVLANGRAVRFIADRGTGDSADFRLR